MAWRCSLNACWLRCITIVCCVLLTVQNEPYFTNWGDIGRAQEPTCVDIPKNMSLCSNIQYERMRLPNLLAHDTLTEVAHQSRSWLPLLNVGCHPDTQLFLCSLFTPVCLESPIFPCRSLCITVQEACEKRMTTYGYHWPDMLRCENFPLDNDMCLKAQHSAAGTPSSREILQTEPPETTGVPEGGCAACSPVDTFENILDHFCRADYVVRVSVRRVRGRRVNTRKARVYKPGLGGRSLHEVSAEVRVMRRALRKPKLLLVDEASCCNTTFTASDGRNRFLVMGRNGSQGLVPTFVLPWGRNRSKGFRKAVRMFDRLDCNDPALFTPDEESGAILREERRDRGGRRGRGDRRRGRRGRRPGHRRRGNEQKQRENNKGIGRGGGRANRRNGRQRATTEDIGGRKRGNRRNGMEPNNTEEGEGRVSAAGNITNGRVQVPNEAGGRAASGANRRNGRKNANRNRDNERENQRTDADDGRKQSMRRRNRRKKITDDKDVENEMDNNLV